MSWEEIRRMVLERDNYRCKKCGTSGSGTNPLHVHHIIPRQRGGTDDLSNLITLCRKCHAEEHGPWFFDCPLDDSERPYSCSDCPIKDKEERARKCRWFRGMRKAFTGNEPTSNVGKKYKRALEDYLN